MKEETTNINWSLVLSFICPGLGQIGRGRLVAGYLFFLAFIGSYVYALFGHPVMFLIMVLLHIFNMIDSVTDGNWNKNTKKN